MSKEESIITQIKALLPLCTPQNGGYNYTWTNCTINKDTDDVNSIDVSRFPYIDVEFMEEVADDQGRNTQYLTNVLTMEIDCIPVKSGTTRTNIINIVNDMKRFFGRNNTLGGTIGVLVITYDRYKKGSIQIKGKFFGVRMTFKVKYYQDKLNP